MTNNLGLSAAPSKPSLEYPFKVPPESGRTLEVAPGVHWIRMPLPYSLDHINLWTIDEDQGWALVDTGVRNEQTSTVWREVFSFSREERLLSRVFVTHMHPQSVGMAGWLTRRFGRQLWMTQLEYMNCRVLFSDSGRDAPTEAVNFYRQAGWSEAAVESYRSRFGNFGNQIHALPDSYRRLVDGEELRIGPHLWRVIVGNGHTPEHACLYCPDLKVLISGDQVPSRITSNFAVHPIEPDGNPLADWYVSMDKLKREVPDDVLVLPLRADCFKGLHAHLDYLTAVQNYSLMRLKEALVKPQRAVDVFGVLFDRTIGETSAPLLGMATGESVAYLNYLRNQGVIRMNIGSDGVAWYEASGSISNS